MSEQELELTAADSESESTPETKAETPEISGASAPIASIIEPEEDETEEADEEEDEGKPEIRDVLYASIFINYDYFDIEIRPDGTGTIDGETFHHDYTLEDIHRIYKDASDEDDLNDTVADIFWSEINDELSESFHNDDDTSGESLHWRRGSENELQKLAQMFLNTEPDENLEADGHRSVRVLSAFDEDDTPNLDEEDWDNYYSDRFGTLMTLALQDNFPTGYSWEYNDGGHRSSYDKCRESITLDLDEPSELPARERMNAMNDLREWLLKRGIPETELEAYGVRVVEKVK